MILWIVTISMLMLFLLLLFLILWKILREGRKALESQNQAVESLTVVVSKAIALIAAHDVLSYQQIQLMESPALAESSPFEQEELVPLSEADFVLLLERVNRGEVLSEYEQRLFEFNANGV